MKMKKTAILIIILCCFACSKKEQIDSIVINASIYTVNDQFNIAESFAINNGKIVAVGNLSKKKGN